MTTFGVHDAVRVDPEPDPDADADRSTITDAELAELAMAADPDTEVDADAVPLSELLGVAGPGTGDLLPDWYMPPTVGGSRVLEGWRRRIVLIIIVSFLLIDAYGLCSTYGHVGFG